MILTNVLGDKLGKIVKEAHNWMFKTQDIVLVVQMNILFQNIVLVVWVKVFCWTMRTVL